VACGGVAGQEKVPVALQFEQQVRVLFENDHGQLLSPELRGDDGADAPVAADDVVVVQGVDDFLHLAFPP
jgi:hypothetical protein